MDRDNLEEQMVECVRAELLRIKQDQGLTNDLLASRIKKPSGARYHTKTVSKFLQNAEPGRNWVNLATAAAHGWRIGRVETTFRPRKTR